MVQLAIPVLVGPESTSLIIVDAHQVVSFTDTLVFSTEIRLVAAIV